MAIGIWFVGARGSVATTTATGLAAIASGAARPDGLVTELPEFEGVPLLALDQFVIGGHDIVETPLLKQAEDLANEGVFPPLLLRVVSEELERIDARIRLVDFEDDPPQEFIAKIQGDIEEFKLANDLETVIVVNVASTEVTLPSDPSHNSLRDLDRALDEQRPVLATSSLYAYAALDAGNPYVDFTPSTGARLPALEELAQRGKAPHAGNDGKTGETLVKTALAPMFATRNLKVRSWASLNILGGGDGASLSEPERNATKIQSKERALDAVLGYSPPQPIHIDYVEDLGQWKTAWNHVSFQGFLGTSMKMQFTWEGCDSALAAPLVIDLARLTALAKSKGQTGALDALAFFFKDPAGTDEHRLNQQFDNLVEWANRTS